MNENQLSKEVIDIALHVHSALGHGLLESAYKEVYFSKSDNQALG